MTHSSAIRSSSRPTVSKSLQPERSAFSLLEVLVACGILVFALAGIAAILPAAGSIVTDGVAQDRAGMLAANVMAELRSRDLFRASAYTGGKSVVLGILGTPTTWTSGTPTAFKGVETFLLNPFISSTVPTLFDAAWPYGDKTIAVDNYRGFFLEDDLQIDSSGTAPAFTYEFGDVTTGTTIGPRTFKRSASWGAIVTPGGPSPQPGDLATLSVATFRKPADAAMIGLTTGTTGTNIFSLPPGNQTVIKTYLSPGSYMLAIPPAPPSALPLRWVRVVSSWTAQSGTSFVVVNDDTPALSTYEQTIGGTKIIPVVGFPGLLRLDQFPVVLK